MTRRWRRTAAAVAALFATVQPPLSAQIAGSVDTGLSIVEYDGFLVSGAALLASSLRYDVSNASIGGQASWTLFESGNQVLQLTGAAGWLTAPRPWRLELAGSAGLSNYAEQATAGHALARARLHRAGVREGVWLGGAVGTAFGDSAHGTFEAAAGAWAVRDRVAMSGTATAVRIGPERHLDLLGTLRWSDARMSFEARVGARPWADTRDRAGSASVGAYGDASLLLPLNDRIEFTLSGGSYASDPVRGVLGARYVSATLRWSFPGTRHPLAAVIGDVLARAARANAGDGDASAARLEIEPSGATYTLRVHARAQSIDVMGDFTDWEPVPLTRIGPDTWEVRLELTPGAHRLNVRLDAGEWVVPLGVRRERTEFGGDVGVVIIG